MLRRSLDDGEGMVVNKRENSRKRVGAMEEGEVDEKDEEVGGEGEWVMGDGGGGGTGVCLVGLDGVEYELGVVVACEEADEG